MIIRIIFLILLSTLAHSKDGGTTVGNGGHGVTCHNRKFYSVDYIYSLPRGSEIDDNKAIFDELRKAKSSMEILTRIKEELAKKVQPSLSASLHEYLDSLKSMQDKGQGDLAGKYVWHNKAHQLQNNIPLKDYPFSFKRLCRAKKKLSLNLITLMKRREDPTNGGVYYEFYTDFNDIQRLENNSPIQSSFHFLHEWLRTLSDNDENIRKMNTYFHSENFFNDPETKVASILNRMLNPPEQGRWSSKSEFEGEEQRKVQEQIHETGKRELLIRYKDDLDSYIQKLDELTIPLCYESYLAYKRLYEEIETLIMVIDLEIDSIELGSKQNLDVIERAHLTNKIIELRDKCTLKKLFLRRYRKCE